MKFFQSVTIPVPYAPPSALASSVFIRGSADFSGQRTELHIFIRFCTYVHQRALACTLVQKNEKI